MVTPPHSHRVRKNNTNLEKPCGRDVGIFKFGLGSPYFVWNPSTSRSSCIMLYVPIQIVREYEHLRTQNSLFLIDEWGNEWETRIHKNRRRVWFNTKELHRLCEKNRVRTSDVCVCKLVQGRGRLCIHVRVIRFAGKRSDEEDDAEEVEEDEESAYKNVGGNQEELKDPYLIAAHIFKLEMAVKNPHYLWRYSGRSGWKNYIPKRIITYYELKISDSLLLVDERGNKWEAEMRSGGTNRISCSGKAWGSLCKTNLVEIGDVCLCEIVQGCDGIHMLVRVIRAHALSRKKGGEEEPIERADLDSESKSDDDDDSLLQMNIPEAKHKIESGSSSARVSWGVEIENKYDNTVESDGDDSEMEMGISKVKHKLKSSHSSVRPSGRILKTLGRNKELCISKSGLAARPNNPYHVWRCTTQRVWPLRLPKRITRYYQLKISDSLFLVDERGNKWEAKIIMGGSYYMACPAKAWGSLCKTNFVNIGDVCLCEFVQGSKGIQMLVRVIRAQTPSLVTRKVSSEEENIELVDVDSEYESDDDDESPKQMNISEAKHKFKSGSSSAPVSWSVKIENKYDDTDENDGDDSEAETDISKANHKLKSSHAPVRRSRRMRNTCGNEESAEYSFEKNYEESLYSDPHEEMMWKRTAQQKKRETQDAYSAAGKKRTRVLRAHALTRKKGGEEEPIERSDIDSESKSDDDDSPLQMDIPEAKHKFKSGSSSARVSRSVNIEKKDDDANDESDGDDGEMEMDISKAKHKLKSSCAPIRRSGRIRNTVGSIEESGEDIFEKIGKEALCSDPHEEVRWKRKAQQKKIETQDAYSAAGKKSTRVLKETACLNDSNSDTEESDGDDSEPDMDISKAKHKLNSSFVPVRRSGRIHNAYAKKKRVEFSCEHDEYESDECGGNIKPCTTKPFHRPNKIEGKLIGSLCLPKKLEWLHSYFKHVHEKDTIAVSFHDDVFGKECKTYIFLEHLEKFCLLEPITDCCILAYTWYLHRKLKRENILDRFRFVNLNYVSRTLARDQRTRAVFDRLTGASTNQLVLVPCNVGSHWILTAIHPCSETVFYLDSLYFRIHDEGWRDIVNDAISMFSASRGEITKKKPSWKVVKAARQPDSKQCGFYVMLYMREIIEIFVEFGLPSLELRFKGEYSRSEIDEVRAEWAEGLIDHLGVN